MERLHAQLDFRDAAIDFSFKYDGGERFNFVIDDKKCEEVHAGHICRVSFRKERFTIQDDRTGVMNLEVRECEIIQIIRTESKSSWKPRSILSKRNS